MGVETLHSNGIVLVTVGTGSFGHAFLEYAPKQDIQEIHVLSHDEFKQEIISVSRHGT